MGPAPSGGHPTALAPSSEHPMPPAPSDPDVFPRTPGGSSALNPMAWAPSNPGALLRALSGSSALQRAPDGSSTLWPQHLLMIPASSIPWLQLPSAPVPFSGNPTALVPSGSSTCFGVLQCSPVNGGSSSFSTLQRLHWLRWALATFRSYSTPPPRSFYIYRL